MSGGDPLPRIHVVAGVVIRADGRILIAQRPAGRKLAGGWEFPGGKLEAGEDRRAGLARELREELGIVVSTPRPLMRLRHVYPYGEVLLDVWVVRHYAGEPRSLDGQALRWCTQAELEATQELLPADKPVVRALRLPERLTEWETGDYSITACCGEVPAMKCGSFDARLRGFLCDSAAQALEAQDRASEEPAGRPRADFLVMAREVNRIDLEGLCAAVALPVYVIGCELEEAWSLGATGVHGIF